MNAAWLDVLREECNRTSQRSVAQRMGYSNTVVNQVLNGVYPGDLARVQAAVEGALLNAEVDCPVLGSISRAQCVKYQRMPFTPTNPANVQLYRTCPACVHNLKSNESSLPASADAPADQPAVSHNTGSRGVASTHGHAASRDVTRPTGRRKRPTHSKGGAR